MSPQSTAIQLNIDSANVNLNICKIPTIPVTL